MMRSCVLLAVLALSISAECLAEGLPGALSPISPEIKAELRATYLETFDKLAKDPPSKETNTAVIKTCSKLIVLMASDDVMKELESNEETEFYYLVGKCTQIQRARASTAPLVMTEHDRFTICVATEKRVPIFMELCRRAGFNS